MKQNLYTLYDNIAEQYGPIFQAVNHATAIRSVQNMKIRAHEDFELKWVGHWDMETGVLITGDHKDVEWATPTYKSEMQAAQKSLPLGV